MKTIDFATISQAHVAAFRSLDPGALESVEILDPDTIRGSVEAVEAVEAMVRREARAEICAELCAAYLAKYPTLEGNDLSTIVCCELDAGRTPTVAEIRQIVVDAREDWAAA